MTVPLSAASWLQPVLADTRAYLHHPHDFRKTPRNKGWVPAPADAYRQPDTGAWNPFTKITSADGANALEALAGRCEPSPA